MSRRGQGEGSIFPWRRRNRETGEMEQVGWCAMLDQGIVDGKRKRRTIYGKTRREVADRLAEALRDHQRGVLPKAGKTTVEQWLTTWLKSIESSVRPRTAEHYEWIVREHLIPSIGRRPVAKLSPAEVETMLNAKIKAKLSPRTAHHIRAVGRNAFKKAERDGLVSRNPFALAAPPRVPRREMKTLTPEQIPVFLEALRADRLEALYVVALGLGLRQGEVLGLRWSDVEFDHRDPETNVPAPILYVRSALQWARPAGGGAGVPHLVEPKSEASRRTLRLPDFVADALRAHRKRWLEEKIQQGPRWLDRWDLVFVGDHGEPLAPWFVLAHLKDVLKGAGLPLIRFHDLRHSCASLLGARKVPAKVVQAILGHSSYHLTMGTYRHVFADEHDSAAATMDRILGSRSPG